MKKLILSFSLIPTLAFASIGEEMNTLLDRFFGGNVEESINPLDSPFKKGDDWENIISDPVKIQKEIVADEERLEDLKADITQKNEQIIELLGEKNVLQHSLFLLDEELGDSSEKLEEYGKVEEKWKADLEQITREKSDLRAELRVLRRAYEKFMKQTFVRSENFGAGDQVSVLKWLFSTKNSSEILEEKRRNTRTKQEQKARLQKLKHLENTLQKKEKHAALIFGQMFSLRQKMAAQKHQVSDFAYQKAKELNLATDFESSLSRNIENLHRQKIEVQTRLNALHAALEGKKIKNKKPSKEEPDPPLFIFPVEGTIKVSASFHDKAYFEKMGKNHEGIDFEVSQGSDVLAVADGVVKKVDDQAFGYSYLILQHAEGFFTTYGHVSEILVNEGQEVSKGDLIAKSGGTPGEKGSGFFSSGPHLHFEVFRGGEYLDPAKYLPDLKN